MANTYQELQKGFSKRLQESLPASAAEDSGDAPSTRTLLTQLIDALPYYSASDFESVFRGVLQNLLGAYMPNDGIAVHPTQNTPNTKTTYSYHGGFNGYQNAFFGGAPLRPDSHQVQTTIQKYQPSLNTTWWGKYAVPVLTDAIRKKIGQAVNASKLNQDLANYNSSFLAGLSASFLGVLAYSYAPTKNAFSAFIGTQAMSEAAASLKQGIEAGQFTANINEALGMGGESNNAATWFLFNLWITLKYLGEPDVDSVINAAETAGLQVPAQVGVYVSADQPGWWQGGYTGWYTPLSGDDLIGNATITAKFPELVSVYYFPPTMPPQFGLLQIPNGYSKSMCQWSGLNWYNA